MLLRFGRCPEFFDGRWTLWPFKGTYQPLISQMLLLQSTKMEAIKVIERSSVCFALQKYKGMWTPRNIVRVDVQKHLQMDAGLLDFLLKSVANTEVNGYYLYRCGPFRVLPSHWNVSLQDSYSDSCTSALDPCLFVFLSF
jgi:hypothetical protein